MDMDIWTKGTPMNYRAWRGCEERCNCITITILRNLWLRSCSSIFSKAEIVICNKRFLDNFKGILQAIIQNATRDSLYLEEYAE